jgi:hypothetical protein
MLPSLFSGNLRGQPVDDVAAALTVREVPFLFVSGYGKDRLPDTFGEAAGASNA